MNKAERISFRELCQAVAKEAGTTNVEAEAVIRSLSRVGGMILHDGKAFGIPEFGTFRPVTRGSRTIHIPGTGERRTISPRTSIKFKPSSSL